MSNLLSVPLAQIRPNKVALRAVDVESEEYLGLVDSIKNKGFMGAITARRLVDAETDEEYYELIDGLHRYTAAKQAGLTEINLNVMDMSEKDVLVAQLMANIHKIETKPMQYTAQLKRILSHNLTMTEAELAALIGKSTAYVHKRLGLSHITNPDIQKLIDDGSIVLANAYALATLPEEEQQNYVDQALTISADEFVPAITKRVKEIKEAARKGREAAPTEFTPTAHLQKVGDIKAELESSEYAKQLIAESGVTDPVEAFNLAIKWVLHLDDASVSIQKAKHEAREAEKAAKKAEREAERKKKKEEADAKKAEKPLLV